MTTLMLYKIHYIELLVKQIKKLIQMLWLCIVNKKINSVTILIKYTPQDPVHVLIPFFYAIDSVLSQHYGQKY